MVPILRIGLLSDFQLVSGDGQGASLAMARAQALLAYLVLRAGERPSRRSIASAFWPDSTEGQSRTNLRQLLHHLRRALPEAERFLEIDEATLAWRADAPATIDAAEFVRAVGRGAAAERAGEAEAALAALEDAVELYRGNLLPQCDDAWVVPERERLRREFLGALGRLIGLYEGRRDYAGAIRYGERLLAEEPLREATYRDLMRCYALHGDRVGALRLYRRCVVLLQDELGVAPERATTEVYERLVRAETTNQDGRRAGGVPPLVGRWREWGLLREAWRRVVGGGGRLVVIAGEAGIGKTRLAEELLIWAAGQGIATARAHCYAAEGRLAYAPVAEWLRAGALRAGWRRLEPAWLAELGRVLPEARSARGVPEEGPADEAARRQRLFEALVRALLATRRPLVLLLDDLQWCDGETLAWLRYLLRRGDASPLLIVATLRVEESVGEHPALPLLRELGRAEQLLELTLGPLDASETATLAAQIIGGDLTAAQASWLFRETEGFPLFAVEQARAGLPTGVDEAAGQGEEVPSPVRAVLAARLAQLSPGAQALAGLAATVGREFGAEVLALASGAAEADLARDLDELWQRRIVRPQGAGTYDFSHDKLREAAYAKLGPAQRHLLHRNVARALESLHAADLDRVSGRLAAHYEQAGLVMQAVEAYGRAAEAAQQVYANDEAIGHFRRALALLATQPDTSERAERELAIQVRLAASLTAQSMFAAPEVIAAYTRAHALSLRLGNTPTAPVLHGLATVTQMQSKLIEASGHGLQLLRVAKAAADPILLVEAHYLVGTNAFWRGDYQAARSHLEQALDLYDPCHRPAHISLYAHEPRVICASRLAYVLFFLGYPERAMESCREALGEARLLAHPFSHLYVLAHLTSLCAECGDFAQLRAFTDEMWQILTSRQGPSFYWTAQIEVLRGWFVAEQEDISCGIDLIQRGLDGNSTIGIGIGFVNFQLLLASALRRAGRMTDGLALLTEILQHCEQTGQQYAVAEIHRQRGELYLGDGDVEVAGQCFQAALVAARRQGTRLFELRALTGLCVVEQRRGRRGEAHRALRSLYEWFTEGFETPDLRAARALLEAHE